MADRAKVPPEIWIGTLAPYLVGDRSCEWALWVQSHYWEWARVPNDFNRAAYQMEHTQRLNEVQAQLEGTWKVVTREGQNLLKLRGSTSTLTGRPDLVAANEDSVLIVDIKTGRPKSSDQAQVMVYMWALAEYASQKGISRWERKVVSGRIVYTGEQSDVPGSVITPEFIERLRTTLRRMGAADTPRKVPSLGECRYCTVAKVECPERVEGGEPEPAFTDLF